MAVQLHVLVENTSENGDEGRRQTEWLIFPELKLRYSRLGRSPKVNYRTENCCGRTFTGGMLFLTPNQQNQSTESACDWGTCCHDGSEMLWWLWGLPCYPTSRQHLSRDNNRVPDLQIACCYHAVTVSKEHSCGNTFYRPGRRTRCQSTGGNFQRQTEEKIYRFLHHWGPQCCFSCLLWRPCTVSTCTVPTVPIVNCIYGYTPPTILYLLAKFQLY